MIFSENRDALFRIMRWLAEHAEPALSFFRLPVGPGHTRSSY
jgi:hypothetical protein